MKRQLPAQVTAVVLTAGCVAASPVQAKTSGLPLRLTGMLRYNYIYKDWSKTYGGNGKWNFDAGAVGARLAGKRWTGSFQYRFYFYPKGHSTQFLQHAWIGYRITGNRQVKAGLNKVPFGILPYASNSWFFSLPYYVGLEDTYRLGVKYVTRSGPWDVRLGFYPRDGGSYIGTSEDSARYSYNVVEGLGVRNKQRNQVNGRITYTWGRGSGESTELGLSVQWAQVPNMDTGKTGFGYAAGIHLKGTYGHWGIKLEAARYRYHLKNPPGQSHNIVVRGAYDYAYRTAAAGTLYVVSLSYHLPIGRAYIDNITFYNDYSRLEKDPAGFAPSEEDVAGASISAGHFLIYVDFGYGRNHPFLSPAFTDGLAAGGGSSWHRRYNLNIGYYF